MDRLLADPAVLALPTSTLARDVIATFAVRKTTAYRVVRLARALA